jgi:hypothetical protein
MKNRKFLRKKIKKILKILMMKMRKNILILMCRILKNYKANLKIKLINKN